MPIQKLHWNLLYSQDLLLFLQTQEPKSKAFFTIVSLFRNMRFYANTLQEAQDWVAEINNTKPLQFY